MLFTHLLMVARDISALAHEIRALREKETQHAAIG